MNRIFIIAFLIINGICSWAQESVSPELNIPPLTTEGTYPMIPLLPAIPTKGENRENDEVRKLEKTYTVMLESRVNVFVPLEVISDINIDAVLVGDQIAEIPFEIELNRKPEKKDYYSIKYSENILDIDNDGQMDTYIYSPQYINEKISKDNTVKIYGEKISKEGTHKKKVYVTVEVGN
ncbi:hypothetical protein [Fusobacterium sp.]|uniref:hypothetical protein n=1 Tax=Fusobacterium sp. TaxID=68766 RepID=UPI0025BE05B8|nr:hypothetical protein [Fusobacterium sp.]